MAFCVAVIHLVLYEVKEKVTVVFEVAHIYQQGPLKNETTGERKSLSPLNIPQGRMNMGDSSNKFMNCSRVEGLKKCHNGL